MVKYLLDEYPTLLETKSAEGYTPLQLALSLPRISFSRILIGAGANQAVRDRKGRNLIHIILCGISWRLNKDPEDIRTLFGLLDRRLIPSMLTERCSIDPGSLTPLAHWMNKACSFRYGPYRRDFNMRNETNDLVSILEAILDIADGTDQKHLELLNGAGSSPMHDAVKLQTPQMLTLMIDRRPDLLHREDATGVTPFEMAVNLWTAEATSNPPGVSVTLPSRTNGRQRTNGSAVARSPESFIQTKETKSERQAIVNVCRERSKHGTKRKLVTLYEANEVAKRLAAKKSGRDISDMEYTSESEETDEEEEQGQEKRETDEVTKWY